MSKNIEFEKISPEKFEFVQRDARIHDTKFETKARGYFADAMLRFRKNKSSVIAAWILLFLLLYSVFAPMISPYTMDDKDAVYTNSPAYIPAIAKLNIGILDGARTHASQNEASMLGWEAMAQETGMNPVIRIKGTSTEMVKHRGKMVERTTYTIETNRYFEIGMVLRTFSFEDFEKIQQWQNETGIQVIFPWVESEAINGVANPNIWYEYDSKGMPVLNADGEFTPIYSTRKEIEGAPYNSIRIEGDDGSYIYSMKKSGAVQCRVCYYNYYQYLNGVEPSYLFGTNIMGQDLFAAIGKGARFSLLFAIFVSAINLSIGAFYGAVQGYYGGWIDMLLDRITDVLSGVPFIVVTTLFQLHLAQKVGDRKSVV